MRYHLQFRRYRLPLRIVVRNAHERWSEREGLLIRIADRDRVGFGEVAPIPVFGTETVNEAEAALRALGEWVDPGRLATVPVRLHCLRGAIAAARNALDQKKREPQSTADDSANYRAVAALLPAGAGALVELPKKAEAGFRVFKWKVGVGDGDGELGLLDDLCAVLPKGAKLRLDANGAWDRRLAERWLERCAERPIEFVEQPAFAAGGVHDIERRRAEDLLLGLSHSYPTPLALDESVVADHDIERWLAAGWPGWFVIKPSLLADVDRVLQRLTTAKATVVFSSALETAVGARQALSVAWNWRGETKALGFGVWPLFVDGRFDGPAAAPFVRWEDVQRINPEVVWNALS